MSERASHAGGDFQRLLPLVALVALSACVFWILRPFLGALVWASVMAVAVYPAFAMLSQRLGGRPRTAATLVCGGLLAVLVAPMAMLVVSLADNVSAVADIARDLLATGGLPAPPDWLAAVPLVGEMVAEAWREVAADSSGLLRSLTPYIDDVARWSAGRGAAFVVSLVQFVFAVVIAGFLCLHAESAAALARRTAERIGGDRMAELLETATTTVRSVATGVVGTAAVQALLSAIGFAIAGLPGVTLLSMLCFVTALAQIGTPLVWIPAGIWLWFEGSTGAVVFLVVWNIGVNISDNFIKPVLMRGGGDIPLTVVFVGVLGGMLAWGFLGMFLGGVLLAVAWDLYRRWLELPAATG